MQRLARYIEHEFDRNAIYFAQAFTIVLTFSMLKSSPSIPLNPSVPNEIFAIFHHIELL